jgi:PEP-CTERM motif
MTKRTAYLAWIALLSTAAVPASAAQIFTDFTVNVSGSADADYLSIRSLGTRPGEYVWSWGSGAHADTFIVEVGGVFASPVPEASTWAMTLIGFAGLGYAAVRRRDAVRASL